VGRSSDVGRRLIDITMRFSDDRLVADAEAVLATLQPREAQVQSETGNWYVRRIMSYGSGDNRIEGVVLTYSDATRLEKTTKKFRHRERQQAALAELGHYALQEHECSRL
jgi:two-component system CheB/CheR fusion protein